MKRNLFLKAAFPLFLSILLINMVAVSQNTPPSNFGKVVPTDFDLPKTNVIDSNTNAVIIANIGTIDFIGDKKSNTFDFVYKIKTRIKILNKKAYDLATVKIG